MSDPKPTPTALESVIPFRIFLEKVPPGQVRTVSGTSDRNSLMLETPEIQLHCDSPECGGIRFFDRRSSRPSLDLGAWTHSFLEYRCRHCQRTTKTYAVTLRVKAPGGVAEAIKFGEWPIFAPHVPARLLSLVGDNQELFRKGRQSESHGLGIAAFAYYRRVVENQKARLIDEIIKVANRVGSKPPIIATLTEAAAETRFSAAVDKMKDAIPEVLRVNGHNPLTLLHSLLSDGLHAQTDEECLAFATDIRVLLTDMCERISTALKDQTEVETALSRLLARQSSRKTGGGKAVTLENREEAPSDPDSSIQPR